MKDRGKIKWMPMMMPEQRKMINDFLEEEKKTEKPILDESEMEIINEQLKNSLEFATPLEVDFYNNGYIKKITSLTVFKTDPIGKAIVFKDRSGEKVKLNFSNIVKVTPIS